METISFKPRYDTPLLLSSAASFTPQDALAMAELNLAITDQAMAWWRVKDELIQAALVRATFLYATYQASFGKSESDRRWVMSTLAAELRDAGCSDVPGTISRMVQVIRNV